MFEKSSANKFVGR
ncbi:hypothetical protein AX774_g4716, partial [Zancudomyces culisetae]